MISANGLLNAVGYLIPSYQQCYVSYVDNGGVRGDIAGGFVGDFQSGIVENDEIMLMQYKIFHMLKEKLMQGASVERFILEL